MFSSSSKEAAVSNEAASFQSPTIRVRTRKRRFSEAGAMVSPVSVLSSPTPQQVPDLQKRRRWSGKVLRRAEVCLLSSPSPRKLRPSQQSPRALRRRSLRPHRALPCPSFNASEVAAIAGLHKHNVPVHALVRCWRRFDRASLSKWEEETGGIVLPEMMFARHANGYVRDAVRTAVTEGGDGILKPAAEAGIVKAIQANAPPNMWKTLTEEALGRARCGRGTRLESTGLAAYEKTFGRIVFRRNQDHLRQRFGQGSSSFVVAGRVDGFELFGGNRWVVEHKRRQRRLFEEVPQYEEVQCQVYMVLTGTTCCRWVQTLGSDVDVKSLARCNSRWSCIKDRLHATAVLLRRLCSGAVFPAAAAELEAMQRDCWIAAPPWPRAPAPAPGKDDCFVQEVSSTSSPPVIGGDSSSVVAMDTNVRKSTGLCVEESIRSPLHCIDSKPNAFASEKSPGATVCASRIDDEIVGNGVPLLALSSPQGELLGRHATTAAEVPPTMIEEENATILDESLIACPEIGSQWEPAPTELDESETECSANDSGKSPA